MQIIYRAEDGKEFDSAEAAQAHEQALADKRFEERLAAKSKEDFDFMVVCAWKGNMAMYELLRDRD